MSKKDLMIRAAEIIETAPGAITEKQAMRQAAMEFTGGDVDVAIDLLLAAVGSADDLRKRTYEPPDQYSLIPPTSHIAIRTPAGTEFIHRNDATAGQMKQWTKEALQEFRGKVRKFERFGEAMDEANLDDTLNYMEQVRSIEQGKSADE